MLRFSVLLPTVVGAMVLSSAPPLATWQPHVRLDAPNVWQLPMPAPALREAHGKFEEALMPHLVDGLIAELDAQPIPCTSLETSRGRFFVMRAGSSTNEELRDSSDLAWISVDATARSPAAYCIHCPVPTDAVASCVLRRWRRCEGGIRSSR